MSLSWAIRGAAVALAVVGLYLLFHQQGELFNVGEFIESITPVQWASTGIGLCASLSVVGAARGILISGASLLGASTHEPRVMVKNLISIIFCEVVAIYGLIMAIVLSTKLNPTGVETSLSASNYYTGFAVFWSGVIVGGCNLICGITVGMNGSAAALADAADQSMFVKMLVVEIFSSVIGLFGLIVGLLVAAKAPRFE